MAEITFYTNPMSRGRIIRWMLEEVGAAYDTVILDYGTPMKAPDYLERNPMGKVPAIEHKGVVITETPAIIAYLAESFPDKELGPKPEERGLYYRWMFFTAGPLEQATFINTIGVTVPAERTIAAGFGDYARTIDTLERAITAHPFIAGERFTAADLYLASHIGAGLYMGTLEKRPSFIDYAKRMSARPAYLRASDIDNALLAQKSPQP